MPLILKDVTLHGVATGSRATTRRLVRAVDHLGLRPVIDSVHDFADAPDALARLESGPFGKVVVRVGS